MNKLYIYIAMLFCLIQGQAFADQDYQLSVDIYINLLTKPLDKPCAKDLADKLKIPVDKCSKKTTEAINYCKHEVIKDMPTEVNHEQRSRIMLRLVACKAAYLDGGDYKNKNVDEFIKEHPMPEN